jgi:nucleoside-diphosphate-sugar epimerase
VKVLIIGCGYVGVPLGALLARSGHAVFGVRRSSDADAALKAAGIQPLLADVTSLADLERLPAPFDWVINTVASSGGGIEDYRRIYHQGTENLLEWLRETPPARFLSTGSTGVYGQTDGAWVDETSPADPAAPTARVLRDTEQLLMAASSERAFPAILLRLAGIYGPGRGYWLRRFLQDVPVFQDEARRWVNMVHRADAAGAIRAILERGRIGEVYNVVDDEPVTPLEMFRWLSERVGKPVPLLEDQTASAIPKRGVTHKRISNRKLTQEVGYQFQFPTFREGFDAELESCHSNTRPGL